MEIQLINVYSHVIHEITLYDWEIKNGKEKGSWLCVFYICSSNFLQKKEKKKKEYIYAHQQSFHFLLTTNPS